MRSRSNGTRIGGRGPWNHTQGQPQAQGEAEPLSQEPGQRCFPVPRSKTRLGKPEELARSSARRNPAAELEAKPGLRRRLSRSLGTAVRRQPRWQGRPAAAVGRPSPARGLGTGTSRCRGATEGFSCFPATPGLAGCSQVFPALHPQHTHACTRTHTRTRPAPTAGPHRRSPALRARPSARPPVRLPQRLCGQGWVTPGADRACAPGSEDTHKVQLQTAQTEFRNRNT